jgi:hypothetical protein
MHYDMIMLALDTATWDRDHHFWAYPVTKAKFINHRL